jgi:ribosomal protein S18 acetylase RimI-like enzyme
MYYSNALDNEARSVGNNRVSGPVDPEEIRFRPFSAEGDDEQQMRELVFDNAFLGQPFDVICPCKRWFSDVVLLPYIRHQPENIHVAVDEGSGRLVGYLTGSTGGGEFEKQQYSMVRRQVVSLAASLTMPWTLFDHASRLFATHVIFKGESERPQHPDAGVHWHYQVAREYRGQGIGRKLLQRFAGEALNADFELIWAEVSSYPAKPPEYFQHRGWSIFDAKPTEIFGDHVDFPVETLCITKPLSELEARVFAA